MTGSASALERWLARAVLGVLSLSLALLVGTIVFGARVSNRVTVVDAATDGAEIVFANAVHPWLLSRATVCERLPRADLSAQRGQGLCDTRLFSESVVDELVLEWSKAARVSVATDAAGGLALTLSDTPRFANGSRILLSAADWRRSGAFSFAGEARIGNPAFGGATGLIVEGEYEFRERLPFVAATEVIKAGSIRRGDQVEVMLEAKPAVTHGHLTPDPAMRGAIRIVAYAEPGPSYLRITTPGGAQPGIVRPNWIDRAISSPFVVALTMLATVLLGAGQLLLGVAAILSRRGGEAAKVPVRETAAPVKPRAPKRRKVPAATPKAGSPKS